MAVLVADHDDTRTRNACHNRRVVHGRSDQPVVVRVLECCGDPVIDVLGPAARRVLELAIDLLDAVAGGGELAGLGKRPGNVVAGVGGFRGQLVDLGQRA